MCDPLANLFLWFTEHGPCVLPLVVCQWERLLNDKESPLEVDVWPWLVNVTADVISANITKNHMVTIFMNHFGKERLDLHISESRELSSTYTKTLVSIVSTVNIQ